MSGKKRFFIIIYIIFMLFFSGCWSRKELNDITIITGMALDKEGQSHYITTVGTDPTKKGGQAATGGGTSPSPQVPYIVFSAQGRTVFEAARNMNLSLPRRNNWSHCEVAIVNESYAREEGVKDILEFFTRDYSRRGAANLVITREKARRILEVPPSLSRDPAMEILEVIEQSQITGKSVQISMYTFIAETLGVTGVSLANYFDIKSFGSENEEVGGRGKVAVLSGAGVFRGYKMVGFLTPTETRGANWLREEIKTGVVIFPSKPGEPGDTTLEIRRVRTKISPVLIEDGGTVQVKIVVSGSLAEYLGQESLREEEQFKNLEIYCSRKIEEEILRVWDKAQNELQADVFRLGDRFYNKYPALAEISPEEWHDVFSKLKLELEVTTNFISTGVHNEALGG